MVAQYHNPLRHRAKPLEFLNDADVARVMGWRRQRMSWAAVARNLGVAEADVRRRFDPAPAATQGETP